MENQKNLILAVTFSIIVLLVFDTFFTKPRMVENLPNETSNTEKVNEGIIPEVNNKIISKTENISYNEDRIYFDMNRIKGSINLYGATIDDVSLKDYKESINQESKNIKVLNPENSKSPFLVRTDWASQNSKFLPNKNTLWSSNKKQYKTGEVIELTWSNKLGITFKKNITIDTNFIFKVEDTIINNSNKNIDVTNYSLIQRKNHNPFAFS